MSQPDATETHEAETHEAETHGPETEGVISLIRRGLAATPELKEGLAITVALGVLVAIGRLVIPVIIQRTIDGALSAEAAGGNGASTTVDVGAIGANAAVAVAVVLVVAVAAWAAQRRLTVRAETGIANLRTGAFNRIHRFSMADHNEARKGTLVARVTSDPEALARFAQWGLFSWTINPLIVIGILAVMAYYAWPLMVLALVIHLPAVWLLRLLQRRQIVVYDRYRTSVGQMLATFSESVTGAAVIRAYGVEDRTEQGLHTAIDHRYRTRLDANRYMAGLFVVGDFFGALAIVAVLVVGLLWREPLGLAEGELVACLILTNLLREPLAEASETFDQTQTAAAAWRKVLDVLDHPVDVVEPEPGLDIPPGPVEVVVTDLDFAYRDRGRLGEPVLREVSVTIPAGTNVAVVGETGSGKTTFVKLLCRLADPVAGSIVLNGVPLDEVSARSRIRSLRMVPQDGFLFDTTVGENVAFGAPDATADEILDAFARLGLDWWIDRLLAGLDTEVGERGDNLSVGERQLVALARAQLADPGLLVLDEATSAVDPETDQALTGALQHLAQGRTMISVAHRLSTAEAADLVLVFDRGRLVEQGAHAELVAAGGIYAGLHAAWLGNTRSTRSTRSEVPAT